MMKINNLGVEVEGKPILKGIDFEVNSGEVVVVMGPNGSGKSTLAYAVAGHPKYIITNYKLRITKEKRAGRVIELDGVDITEMKPNERANAGLFLANQYPMAVPGLTVNSFLWQIYKKRNEQRATSNDKRETINDKRATSNDKRMNVIEFRKWVEQQAKLLSIKPELLKRGLNDGFSGGEKKKLEILQMLVFRPKYVVLDEIDSGLDVDALRLISKVVAKAVDDWKIGVIVITHYNRILKYLKANRVLVLSKGEIVRRGTGELAEEIESEGYKNE